MIGSMAGRHAPGDVIDGRFTLGGPLGRGSFGMVWRASDGAQGGAPVALKILFDQHRQDAKRLARFAQEARILARLNHPNIGRLIASRAEGEDIYLAMELIEGETLHGRLELQARRGRPVPLQGVAWLLDQLASAIDYAHAAQVIHRDLKPKNVMVNRSGRPPFLKVLDFGIAKVLVGSEVEPTTVGRLLGSLMYVAPEQFLARRVDQRADVFALGTLVFEILTLCRPWARDPDQNPLPWTAPLRDGVLNSQLAVARRIAREPRPVPSASRPDLPKAIDVVILKALAIDPESRFATAGAFARAFRDALLAPGRMPSTSGALRGNSNAGN